MILLDAVYIHSYGGKTLLDLVLKFLIKNKYERFFYLLLDRRYNNDIIKNFTYHKIIGREKIRKFFYKKRNLEFSIYLCLNNVPPPITINKLVWIYFHNDLLINCFNVNIDFLTKISLIIKQKYILLKKKKQYNWIVQNNLMKRKLSKRFSLDNSKIRVLPIFEETDTQNYLKEKNTFLYVSSPEKHKNLQNLIFAFSNLSEKIKNKVELHLTINKDDLTDIKYKDFNIIFHGKISKNSLFKIYEKSEFLIYPSFKESFGLPMIEAAQMGCKILASDLPYVHEIIKPSLVFNPYDNVSMSKTINLAVKTTNLKNTELKIKNKLPELVNKLINKLS